MAIFSRFVSARHLDETAMAAICSAATAGGVPPSHPHLRGCAHCRGRFAAFVEWLDQVRNDAHAEADAAFPPERLVAQQALILRRLEALERPARVIAFPRTARPATTTKPFAPRWIAAAAAAGLLIGLATGQFIDLRRSWTAEGTVADSATSQTGMGRISAGQPISTTPFEDEALFYGEHDTSLRPVRYAPLQLFDDVTPRARDLER